jgi:hypothetical protein
MATAAFSHAASHYGAQILHRAGVALMATAACSHAASHLEGLKSCTRRSRLVGDGGVFPGPHFLHGLCASLLADFGLSNTLVLNRFRVRRQFSGQIIIAEASQRF